MADIFISYRRKESKAHARLLFERLEQAFGDRVFMDVDGLVPGENFRDKIGGQLKGCTVLVAMMGPQWAQASDEAGQRRLDDPRDWVRLEIVTALQRGIMVIPVLIDGATMPPEADLPPELRPLLERQALTLDVGQGFGAGMETLLTIIRARVRRTPTWAKPVALLALAGLVGGGGYWALGGSVGVTPAMTLMGAPAATPATPATPVTAAADPHPPGRPFRDCEDEACPWMLTVPAGQVMMGSPASEPDRSGSEGPPHRVDIARFALGQFEVTQGQWKALMGRNPSTFKDCGDLCPVEQVSWEDAQAYVKKLREKTGQPYRLPSEAEWEYAARAGTTTPFHTGAVITTSQANFDGNHVYNGSARGEYRQQTVPVGRFKANAFGLSDMHGNVWEWVEDCWHETYEQAVADGEPWTRPCADPRRVLRGGSWVNGPRSLRSAGRGKDAPDARDEDAGLRVARALPR